MKNFVIDLYEYFSAKREVADKGILTAYIHDDAVRQNRKRPAMLVVAGGGYEHVSAREREPIAFEYLAKGFNVFVLEYTVKVSYPIAFFEAALAMAYLRKNCDELNIFSEKIAGVGFSAGAHLLGCLGIIPKDEMLAKLLLKIDYFKDLDIAKTIRPNAMVMCYPVVSSLVGKRHDGSFKNIAGDDNRLIEALSLDKRVDSDSPEAFIWHTFNDGSVPVYSSLSLAMAYEKNKIPFSLHIFDNGRHGLSLANSEVYEKDAVPSHSADLESWLDLSVNWLKEKGFCL